MTATITPATGELVHIDPRDVIVGTNVRLDARLDKKFVESIRERGVLVPIVGYRNEDGAFVVLYGQRRTLASVEAERPTIPAYVVDGPDEADRLVDQMAENDHRASLTKSERAQGFAELVGLGLSAAEVAKRTAAKTSTVKAAVAVAGSEIATKALAENKSITIEQAAGLAEFEDDEEYLTRLLRALEYGYNFKHTLESCRDDREDKAICAAHAEKLRAEGQNVVDEPQYDDATIARVYSLTDPADDEQIGEEEHAVCPGHAVFVETKWVKVDPPEDAPEGTRPTQVKEPVARAVCLDWKANGHARRNGYGSSATKKAEDMTEEEREAARVARRDVIDSNKAWVIAEKLRIEWLTQFLTRKSVPRTAHTFIAMTLASCPNYMYDHKIAGLYADLVGCTPDAASRETLVENATPDRAQVLTLAHTLAGYEVTLSNLSWRSVSPATARYLTFLAENGYELSEVEKRAAGIE